MGTGRRRSTDGVTKRKIRIERPPGCRFDEQAAGRAVRFFREELRHTKGRRHVGKPFGLTSEQEQDLREIFGRVDEEGNRLIRQVFKGEVSGSVRDAR